MKAFKKYSITNNDIRKYKKKKSEIEELRRQIANKENVIIQGSE